MTQLSPHFTLAELTRSDYATRYGIDNAPSADVLKKLVVLGAGLERVRAVLSVPLHINSGYRCAKLNQILRGASNSAHLNGLAADFRAPDFGSPYRVAMAIAERWAEVEFDQLIQEGNWVHIAFPANGLPRHELLTARFLPSGVRYEKGILV